MNAKIETLKNERNKLIKQFDCMAKEHKKTYSDIDISEAKSEAEKLSEKAKADVLSKANAINIQIRELKKTDTPHEQKIA